MMDEKTRALLGDREAQEAITARGELLPCPHCGGRPVIVIGTLRNAGKYSVTCGMCFSATGWNTLEADATRLIYAMTSYVNIASIIRTLIPDARDGQKMIVLSGAARRRNERGQNLRNLYVVQLELDLQQPGQPYERMRYQTVL